MVNWEEVTKLVADFQHIQLSSSCHKEVCKYNFGGVTVTSGKLFCTIGRI